MSEDEARALAVRFTEALVREGPTEHLWRHTTRVEPHEFRAVVAEYGGTPCQPTGPLGVDVMEVDANTHPTWAVDVQLWTVEEGPSDLTLQLEVVDAPGGPRVAVDDCHVL